MLVGQSIAGGCEHCEAVQQMTRPHAGPVGVWSLVVLHQAACPSLDADQPEPNADQLGSDALSASTGHARPRAAAPHTRSAGVTE
jgi:hypothetical protein